MKPETRHTANPTSNPPGGGSWRWDAAAAQWVARDVAAPNPLPAQPAKTPPAKTAATTQTTPQE